jgi:hypothetical protein
LFDDTQERLKTNSGRICTCGFSGGAKVASYVALHNNNIKGVIAVGAGLPDETPTGNFNFSFTAIAGEGDMNMTDLIAINNEFDKTQTKHRIIFFDGKHEWAPESVMNTAFTGLQFDAMRENIIPKRDMFINTYIAKSRKKIEGYSGANNLIKAERECNLSIAMLDGITGKASWFKAKDSSIMENAAYKKQSEAQQKLFAVEQNWKALYMRQFENGDINSWTKTIEDLQIKSKTKTAEGAMYQRLLAYLSLAFYSISNQLISAHQNNAAHNFVELYKLADPANSEPWYFSAILHARSNNSQAAEADLRKAIVNGFSDKKRLMMQPEFQNKIDLVKIENSMK